jgi:hypothetical protein
MEFTPLDQAVLNWMASHNDQPGLAEQLSSCEATDRDLSSLGSHTNLEVPHDKPRIDLSVIRNPVYGPLIDETKGIKGGAISLLYFDDYGYAETLEISVLGDSFDESVTDFTLRAWS